MNHRQSTRTAALACLVLSLAVAPHTRAEEEKKLGWFDAAELSYVLTEGNSESSTLGFKNKLSRVWAAALFELNAGAIRAESTTTTIFATGTPSNYEVDEVSITETTAENYFLDGRYNKSISPSFYWYVGAGWNRNRPAGIDSRYYGGGGVGNIWVDRETVKFRTDYGVTYTKEEPVSEPADFDDSFIGARITSAYLHTFGAATTYTFDLILDENLEETSDFRADMTNAVAVSMSKRLAMKLGLQFIYDNEPALREIDLFDSTGAEIGTVFTEADDLDTIFTASLVLNF